MFFLKVVYYYNILYMLLDLVVQIYVINVVLKWECEEWGIILLVFFYVYGRIVWRLLDVFGCVGDVFVLLEVYICFRNGGMVGKNFFEIFVELFGMCYEVRIDIVEFFNFELWYFDVYEFNFCSIEYVVEKIIKDEKLLLDMIW